MSKIIESYLSENTLNLSHTINQLLISTTLPPEAEIIMIGASLDELSKRWLKLNSKNTKNMSGRKKVNLFLKELSIEIGESEEKARDYRNIPAHGQEINPEKLSKLIYLTKIYRTLLNRIIFKILKQKYYYNIISGEILDINEKIPEEDFKKNMEEIKKYYNNL